MVEAVRGQNQISDKKSQATKFPFPEGEKLQGMVLSADEKQAKISVDGIEVQVNNRDLQAKENDKVEVTVRVNTPEKLALDIKIAREEEKQVAKSSTPSQKTLKDLQAHVMNRSEEVKAENEKAGAMTVLRTNLKKVTAEALKEKGLHDIANVTVKDVVIMEKKGKQIDKEERIDTADKKDAVERIDTADKKDAVERIDIADKKAMAGIKSKTHATAIKNTEITNDLTKVEAIKKMTKDQLIHFLSSKKPLTLENLYNATRIEKPTLPKDSLTEEEVEKIEKDIKKILNANELSTKENLEISRQLVKKNIPLDERTIETLKFVENIGNKEILSTEEVEDFIKEIKEIHIDDLRYVVASGKPLNLQNIVENKQKIGEKYSIQKSLENLKSETQEKLPILTEAQADKVVEADKVVQELQLKMTFESAMKLNIKGVNLYEEQFMELKEKLSVDMQVKMNADSIDIEVKDIVEQEIRVTEVVQEKIVSLEKVSEETVAKIALQSGKIKLQELSMEDITDMDIEVKRQQLRTEYAVTTYDDLRTEVRKDLGDSVEKAFRNVTEILEDLEMESSTFNIRAVKILGRNQMEITPENIEQVKSVDMQLDYIIKRLSPSHISELIRENISVLETSISKLVAFVDMKEADVMKNPSQEVAKQIFYMDSHSLLEKEERESVVGTYRILHTVTKHKNAAVGFLMKNDAEVTMENLLEASKYIKETKGLAKTKFDVEINNQFGLLEKIEKNEATIKEQIISGTFEKTMEIDNLLEKEMMKMKKLPSTKMTVKSTEENTVRNVIAKDVTKDEATDTKRKEVKEIPEFVEKLIKTLQTLPENTIKEAMGIKPNMNFQEWKAFLHMKDASFAVKEILQPLVGDTIKNEVDEALQNLFEAGTKGKSQQIVEGFERILGYTREEKARVVEKVLDRIEENNIEEVTKLQSTGKAIMEAEFELSGHKSLSETIAKDYDYYTVPFYVDGSLQQVNMQFLDRQASGDITREESMIYMSFTTKNMGKTNARMQITRETVAITIHATKKEANTALHNFEKQLYEVAHNAGYQVHEVGYDEFFLPQVIREEQTDEVQEMTRKVREREMAAYLKSRFVSRG